MPIPTSPPRCGLATVDDTHLSILCGLGDLSIEKRKHKQRKVFAVSFHDGSFCTQKQPETFLYTVNGLIRSLEYSGWC